MKYMQIKNPNPNGPGDNRIKIVTFSNTTRKSRRLLKKFVGFHWEHYKHEPQYVPLFDYEYLGFKLLGIKGFFKPENPFFKHTDMKFFLAFRGNEIVGRCNAFVNHDHNRYWNDKVGFFGEFEAIDDHEVAEALLKAAGAWLKTWGMEAIRGPQNLPVNEATPGLLTDGFDSRPVIYYSYNKPYYANLVKDLGFKPIKKVFSLESSDRKPLDKKFVRLIKQVIKRYHIEIETWRERPLEERRQEMLEIYNEAWGDNWGFVPFRQEEFYKIIQDMQLIMDKDLFIFLYINKEPVAFFGGIPNLYERMVPMKGLRRFELFRAVKMLLTKNRIKGFRVGYLGVKKKYRIMGLDGVIVWKQKLYGLEKGYRYADFGWILEDNKKTINLIEKTMGATLSKTYTIFEKPID